MENVQAGKGEQIRLGQVLWLRDEDPGGEHLGGTTVLSTGPSPKKGSHYKKIHTIAQGTSRRDGGRGGDQD